METTRLYLKAISPYRGIDEQIADATAIGAPASVAEADSILLDVREWNLDVVLVRCNASTWGGWDSAAVREIIYRQMMTDKSDRWFVEKFNRTN